MKVTSPEGRTWRVRRRWWPWRRRAHTIELGGGSSSIDLPLGDDPISFVIGIVVCVFLLPFVVLFALVAGEVLLLLLLLPLFVLLRVLLRRPWVIEVVDDERRLRWTESVVGWRASQERIALAAQALASGDQPVPPRDHVT